MKLMVLLNAGAGTLKGMEQQDVRRRIERGFADAGADADVQFIDMPHLEQQVRQASESGVDAVIAGGGDGTLNAVANALVRAGGKAFGVLPLGTFNHFARELSVPLDLDQAVAALARGRIEEIPVAALNGRIFLNFSAIGLHPDVVSERDQQESRGRRSKMWSTLTAFLKAVFRLRPRRVRLSSGGKVIDAHASSIIVCNNAYQMKAFGVEAASVPQRGLLNVYVATAQKPLHNIWLLLRAMLGTLRHTTPNFHVLVLPEITVETRHNRETKVSLDGELLRLRPPLVYRIHQQPLRVLMPARQT